jgi:hypothetical protein
MKDWKVLLLGGNNGIICIVMSLFWWGKEISKLDRGNTDDWLDAVRDVDAVFSACIMAC